MPDNVLDYQNSPPPLTRKQRIATYLNRISWALLGVSSLAIGAVFLFMPRHSRGPYAALFDRIFEFGPILNICGAICGISSTFLWDRWSPGVAFILNAIAIIMLPSSLPTF